MLIAEYWADWLGIELNHAKRTTPHSASPHLGFIVNLREKVVAVTAKHVARILQYFDHLLCAVKSDRRIRVKRIQQMLGLQI